MKHPTNKDLAQVSLREMTAKLQAHDAHGLDTNSRSKIAGEIFALLEDQAIRRMIREELSGQQADLQAELETLLAGVHTDKSACRRAAQETPRFRELMNREAMLGHSDITAARHAIAILELALA